MMIKPSIEQLTKGEINRYALVIATAKCARIVTDEYVEQREKADRLIANKQTDKPLTALINSDLRDNKAVENAVQRIYSGEYKIVKN
ncbi:MAG: DNA-directed RNA polymerase subunit omega [Clostridia bacterium]|nr:DNA-directed RNA polymerase subunit omega [Clostridia bacterium]MBO4428874.1 DNA-directed RNA polymerase subunit omega [Clostridia bacterium]